MTSTPIEVQSVCSLCLGTGKVFHENPPRKDTPFSRCHCHGVASSAPLTGVALGRWCYENPNLAASTIEGLRGSSMAKEERDLLLMVAHIVLAHHNSSGPGMNMERQNLRRAIDDLRNKDQEPIQQPGRRK